MLLCFTYLINVIVWCTELIGGWASNNKFSLIGAVRAASQMISYEAMGLSLIALLMMTGTLSLRNLSATVWNELECFLPTIIVPDILICALQKPIELLLI
jgi:NADH:ubiquinone oxidoreductase subunit H